MRLLDDELLLDRELARPGTPPSKSISALSADEVPT